MRTYKVIYRRILGAGPQGVIYGKRMAKHVVVAAATIASDIVKEELERKGLNKVRVFDVKDVGPGMKVPAP